MMLPTQVSDLGGSAFQNGMRAQQTATSSGAHVLPLATQQVADMAGQEQKFLQGARTLEHAANTAALSSVPTNQAQIAQGLVHRFRKQAIYDNPQYGLNTGPIEMLAAAMQQQGMLG